MILLSVFNERELYKITKDLDELQLKYTTFKEPDLGYALTSITIEPSDKTTEYCAKFKTALRPAFRGGFNDTQINVLDKKLRELKQVVNDMKQTEQFKGQSILDHGLAVWNRYEDLKTNQKLQWFLPDWFNQYKELLFKSLLDDFTIEKYTTLHDAGKPYCLTSDENGKKHFINHAQVSEKTYLTKCGKDEQVAKLIAMDMDVHLLKTENIPEFANRKEASTLLLVGLAEIHANAEACGGFNTNSFKIKLKHLNKKGKKICEALETMEIFLYR